MLQTFKNAWNTKDIRKKILFTLMILVIYRIGAVIPVPFVDGQALASLFDGNILQYMSILSGGSLEQATLFALGVTPYINASIIIQLLAVAFPKLGELSKDEAGKKLMNFITRILTVVLAIVTAVGYYFLLKNNGYLSDKATGNDAWIYAVVIVACYCAGASLIMWLGERINENGLGNGISIILFANIIAVLPNQFITMIRLAITAFSSVGLLQGFLTVGVDLLLIAIVIAMTVFVIWVTGSERRITVQYAKQIKGRKMYGGQSSALPIKLNMVGVMPVIFASTIVSVVPTILALCGVESNKDGNFWERLSAFLASDGWFYPVIFLVLIIAFTYFYTEISFNPKEIANNLKKQGGTIAGIRQGRPTAEFIQRILGKVTLVGAIFLAIIAIIPIVGGPHILQRALEKIFASVLQTGTYTNGIPYDYIVLVKSFFGKAEAMLLSQITSVFTFGGTTLLIVVGVVLETYRELEAQLTMRNYKKLL